MVSNHGVIITTHNRSKHVKQVLDDLHAASYVRSHDIIVVDDGSRPDHRAENKRLCDTAKVRYILLNTQPSRGLAAALNVGLSWHLADPDVRWISYFQDDVRIAPNTFTELFIAWDAMVERGRQPERMILTGHDAPEHQPCHDQPCEHLPQLLGCRCLVKHACRATHMLANRSLWESVMPIRSLGLNLPRRGTHGGKGMGSDVDWWICRDAPGTSRTVVCVPGLVRHICQDATQSTWGNRAPEYARRGSANG